MHRPPSAPRRPHVLTAHGDRREDDWYWLHDPEDPDVLAYLKEENDYTAEALAPLQALRQTLFQEIKNRIRETDVGAPTRRGGWWYYTRTVEGQQYAIHCRRHDPERRRSAPEVLELARGEAAGEEVLLDENRMAGDSDYFSLGVFDLSPSDRYLAYATDYTGGERYTLRIRDLESGRDLDDEIDNVYYSAAWSADSQVLFYTRPDDALRPWQIWRHHLGQPPDQDVKVFEDPDERFFVGVGTTRSERYIVISSGSKLTSEDHLVDASRPDEMPRVVAPRRHGVEYGVDHAVLPGGPGAGAGAGTDVLLVLTNDDGAENFKLMKAPVETPGREHWEEMIPHRPEVRLTDVDPFAGHLVVWEREQGLERIRILALADGTEHAVEQPEAVFSVGGGSNPEWDARTLRFGYTSLVTPPSAIDYDMDTRRRTVVKQQEVLGGYEPDRYHTERLWATAPDGTAVPISVVMRNDLARSGDNPCLLYGYGAYEISIDPTFSSARLSLLQRGFVFAIAHVRGGGELGRRWYEDGKLDRKTNTFTDFVACAEHLVAHGYTDPEHLVIRGGSAGGLLMGAVANARPDLWRAVVAEVPFVDVLTTMLDPTLPLTPTEWEEWGNPIEDEATYAAMKAYSPYDNLAPKGYPAMYVTGGLNDPRVGFWEPAKWVARQRALRTDGNLLVLKTEMDAGHGGPSGRYDAWEDEAQVQAFILAAVGKAAAD